MLFSSVTLMNLEPPKTFHILTIKLTNMHISKYFPRLKSFASGEGLGKQMLGKFADVLCRDSSHWNELFSQKLFGGGLNHFPYTPYQIAHLWSRKC